MTVKHDLASQKKGILMRERVWCHEILIPCCTTVLFFCRISLMCGELPLNSLRSFVSTLVLVVVDSSWSKIEECLHKIAISSMNWESNRRIILSLSTDLTELSVLNICSDSTLFSLFICASLSLFLDCSFFLVPLCPWIGLRPPSNSYILSLCLSITTASLCDPVQNTTTGYILSLYAGAL